MHPRRDKTKIAVDDEHTTDYSMYIDISPIFMATHCVHVKFAGSARSSASGRSHNRVHGIVADDIESLHL